MFELPIENNWGGHGPKEMSLFPGSLNTAGGNVREGGPGNSVLYSNKYSSKFHISS